MALPFATLHELYRILYLRAEAQAKADKEREEKEKAEAKRNRQPDRAFTPMPKINRKPKPTDDKDVSTPAPDISSPLVADALEDALEDLMDGGVM